MQEYVTRKQVAAQAMNRLQYNQLRGWTLPADEDGSDEGYLVEYKDGGEPNHPDYAGYISWCPKEQFENAASPVANKVEVAHIQAMVRSLEFKFERIGDTTTTVCYAFLPNGFTVGKGDSACVDPANFDYELGCKYAKERAVADATNNLWMLEGYVLKTTGAVTKL